MASLRVCGVLIAGALAAIGCSSPGSRRASPESPRDVALSATIRLPVVLLERNLSGSNIQSRPDALAVITGGPDEPPQGPGSFAVMDDGAYLVADPVRKRMAVYDSDGRYRSQWTLGFAADSVTHLSNGAFRIRESVSGEARLYDSGGKLNTQTPPAEQPLEARLAGPNEGVITGRQSAKPLSVKFESGAVHLISLEPLASGPDGAVYVALEVSPGGDAIEISKRVRKYAPDGTLVSEVPDIPLDYYFAPNDELRVEKGVLYQMAPSRTEIRMNRWDMN
jgi:hypothetical protein